MHFYIDSSMFSPVDRRLRVQEADVLLLLFLSLLVILAQLDWL